MENLKYWIAFSKAGFSGSNFVKKLWMHFDSIKEAWLASSADLIEIEGLQYKQIERFVEERKSVDPDDLLDRLEKRNITALTLEDDDYPFLLRQIYDPPAVIYIKGNPEVCSSDKTLAIVGSRKASHYIIEILGKLINDLHSSDVTVVSGMALGVDSCAHRAALKNNLKTIAVLGSGFDYIYPAGNKDLFNQIIDNNGAVISEYFPEEEPEIWKFPKRNRIITGLSKGTLIGEASLKSGALISAKLCLDQNRELMCIPGLITNRNTEGVYKLIKEGAAVVTNAEDILNNMGWNCLSAGKNNDKSESLKIELLDNERKIYEIIDLEPKQFDDILNETQLNIDEVMFGLTTLELNGLIKQVSGQRYIKVLSS